MTIPTEPLGDRVKLLELAVATIADRTLEIEELATATDRLSESTGGLESALREVGEVRAEQRSTQARVDEVESKAAAVAAIAVPRSRLWLTIIVVAVLAAAVGWGWLDRRHIKAQMRHEHIRTCQMWHELHPDQTC